MNHTGGKKVVHDLGMNMFPWLPCYNDSLPVMNQLTQLDKSASYTTVLFRSVRPPSHAFEDRK